MFGLILIVAVTLSHFYVLQRAGTLPWIRRSIPRRVFIAAGVGLWALFVLARLLGHDQEGALARALEVLGMHWIGVLLLCSVSFFVADMATGFGRLLPGMTPALRTAALVSGVLLSAAALVQGLRQPVVENYDLQIAGLPPQQEGMVIVGLSDLHLGSLIGLSWMEERLAQVQAERPDMIVLLGDIFEGHGRPRPELLSALGKLSAPLGVWAVPGNHEVHGLEADPGLIESMGIHLLRNSWKEVAPGLVIAGADDLTTLRRSKRSDDVIAKALADRPGGATIFLTHTPWQAERAAAAGAGLMLSGHTHGGQIWPFGYLVRLVYPLLAGRYEVCGMPVIVCRGTGTWGPRMRLWQRGEILRVTLHRKLT